MASEHADFVLFAERAIYCPGDPGGSATRPRVAGRTTSPSPGAAETHTCRLHAKAKITLIRGRVAPVAYEFVGAEPLQPDGVNYSAIAPKQAFSAARLLGWGGKMISRAAANCCQCYLIQQRNLRSWSELLTATMRLAVGLYA